MCQENVKRGGFQFEACNDVLNRCILTQKLFQQYKAERKEKDKRYEKMGEMDSVRYGKDVQVANETKKELEECRGHSKWCLLNLNIVYKEMGDLERDFNELKIELNQMTEKAKDLEHQWNECLSILGRTQEEKEQKCK